VVANLQAGPAGQAFGLIYIYDYFVVAIQGGDIHRIQRTGTGASVAADAQAAI
jgi:hypothetical protein